MAPRKKALKRAPVQKLRNPGVTASLEGERIQYVGKRWKLQKYNFKTKRWEEEETSAGERPPSGWTSGWNSHDARKVDSLAAAIARGRSRGRKVKKKNPAKKKAGRRKLVGAAKAAFLKLMSGGRKKAGAKKKAAKKSAKKNAGSTSKRKPSKKSAKKVARGRRRRKNPEEAAVEFYRKTHGRDPEVDVLVTENLKEHGSLVGMGRLEELAIKSAIGGHIVDLSGFRGAVLAMNEKGTQLFIKGGDQSVDLDDFEISAPHEIQVLGELVSVVYHTRKDHLTADTGGKGSYEHFFHKPRPTVTYDARNKLLTIAGGDYELKDVGVVR